MPDLKTGSVAAKCNHILDTVANAHDGLSFADIVEQTDHIKSSTHSQNTKILAKHAYSQTEWR